MDWVVSQFSDTLPVLICFVTIQTIAYVADYFEYLYILRLEKSADTPLMRYAFLCRAHVITRRSILRRVLTCMSYTTLIIFLSICQLLLAVMVELQWIGFIRT